MRITLAVASIIFLFACNDAGKNEPPADVADSTKQNTASAFNCYMNVLQRDTLVACLQLKGNEVTGRLTFDNFEKDGSSGDVHGTMHKDTIKLWYDFNSEGTRSVMEVYFLKDGDKLYRGIGDVATKGDTAYFSGKDTVKYTTDYGAFIKMPCSSIDEKYRCEK